MILGQMYIIEARMNHLGKKQTLWYAGAENFGTEAIAWLICVHFKRSQKIPQNTQMPASG